MSNGPTANANGVVPMACHLRAPDHFSSSRSYAAEYHAKSYYLAQERLCQQLRTEVQRNRTKVSVVCADLIRYVVEQQVNDPLVLGFSSQKENPFRDKATCTLI